MFHAILYFKVNKIFFYLFLTFVIVVITALGTYYFISSKITKKEQVFCTMEAKLCPDGSYVGRVGPNCEFTECPRE